MGNYQYISIELRKTLTFYIVGKVSDIPMIIPLTNFIDHIYLFLF